MAFQSVPETASIEVIFTLNNVTVQNVHYGRLPGGYTLTDLQALADAVDLIWALTTINDVPPEVVYVETVVRGLEFENDQVATANASAGPGTGSGATMPNNVTFAIKKGSGLTGRSARGRTYWIGIEKAAVEGTDENFLEAVKAEAFRADIAALRGAINGVGLWEAVIVSRFSGGAERTTGVTFPWLTTTITDLRIDTQRGRLPKT